MSEKQKAIIDGLNRLPEDLQDRFVDQITGAAIAVEMIGEKQSQEEKSA